MIKEGIFHPELLQALGELRHRDMIVIGDAGLPVPPGVKRIDLGWIKNNPRYLDVLREIRKVLVIEEAVFAKESREVSPGINDEALMILGKNVKVSYVKHDDLKKISEKAKVIVLTGEFTGYTNVILTCGCAY